MSKKKNQSPELLMAQRINPFKCWDCGRVHRPFECEVVQDFFKRQALKDQAMQIPSHKKLY